VTAKIVAAVITSIATGRKIFERTCRWKARSIIAASSSFLGSDQKQPIIQAQKRGESVGHTMPTSHDRQ